jgi:hypothetical protein
MKPTLRVVIFVTALVPVLPSFGGARHFTFLYEANTSAPGSLELENWVTWRHAAGPGRFDQFDFRHELEYGITEKFQGSIYLADWFYESDPEQLSRAARWRVHSTVSAVAPLRWLASSEQFVPADWS